ncbi:MAG: glycosyltransferase family 4 protein [Acidimicrobiia bacterium]|nr:glycosyltransferase family 4 protein [Acidimicrobiia bacterium]
MRILSVTAGAAAMYCGSCLRDNALARALLRLDHDVTLLPVYTPTRVDEENVSADRVLFGGVSVYLQQHAALFRRTPWLLDRLWDSKVFLSLAAKRSVQVNPQGLGALAVSTLQGEEGFQRKEIAKLLHWLKDEAPYDVINLPNALLIALAGPMKRASGRPICVTLQGEDIFLEGLPGADRARAHELIREHARHVDLFVAVSDYYRGFCARYFDIPAERIAVAPLGVSVDDLVPGGRTRLQSDPFVLGYFARVAPEKSLHLLAETYRLMRQERGLPPSRLEVGGYLAPEYRAYLARIERQMREWGLGDEFVYRGELDRTEKAAFLRSLDAFCVPSLYVEPKGLYLLEAMACGIPVVAPNHGALTEMVERTGGGLLVAPGEPASFADGIMALREHPGQAREMGLCGAAGVREHYTVRRMAERVVDAYRRVVEEAGAREDIGRAS